jgi:hypothetical protein
VSNIYKYYVAYKLALELQDERRRQREQLKEAGRPDPERTKAGPAK